MGKVLKNMRESSTIINLCIWFLNGIASLATESTAVISKSPYP
jgi:hypothetical protein